MARISSLTLTLFMLAILALSPVPAVGGTYTLTTDAEGDAALAWHQSRVNVTTPEALVQSMFQARVDALKIERAQFVRQKLADETHACIARQKTYRVTRGGGVGTQPVGACE